MANLDQHVNLLPLLEAIGKIESKSAAIGLLRAELAMWRGGCPAPGDAEYVQEFVLKLEVALRRLGSADSAETFLKAERLRLQLPRDPRPRIQYKVSHDFQLYDPLIRGEKRHPVKASPHDARDLALEFLCQQLRKSNELELVDTCPSGVHGNLNPSDWHFFAVIEKRSHRTGGTQHVAVSKTTGEVRDLGNVG
jgi:hypothetical protein